MRVRLEEPLVIPPAQPLQPDHHVRERLSALDRELELAARG
jgi:hypothetical protein